MAMQKGTYIYMLKEREHIRCKDEVYKVGYTTDFKGRMRSYPNDNLVMFVIRRDCPALWCTPGWHTVVSCMQPARASHTDGTDAADVTSPDLPNRLTIQGSMGMYMGVFYMGLQSSRVAVVEYLQVSGLDSEHEGVGSGHGVAGDRDKCVVKGGHPASLAGRG